MLGAVVGGVGGIGRPKAATNLNVNGGFETNTTGWTASGAGTTLTRVTTEQYFGAAACQVHTTATGRGALKQVGSVSASAPYVASCWVKGTAGNKVQINLADNESGQLLGQSGDITFTGDWQQVSVSDTGGAATSTAYMFLEDRTGGQDFYIDGAQFEAGLVVTPYIETNGATATRNDEKRVG